MFAHYTLWICCCMILFFTHAIVSCSRVCASEFALDGIIRLLQLVAIIFYHWSHGIKCHLQRPEHFLPGIDQKFARTHYAFERTDICLSILCYCCLAWIRLRSVYLTQSTEDGLQSQLQTARISLYLLLLAHSENVRLLLCFFLPGIGRRTKLSTFHFALLLLKRIAGTWVQICW